MIRLIPLLLAALSAAISPAAAPRPVAHAPVDWSRTFNRTADGNFVQGNPAAKVKLVEYLSLTCPHCAAFEGEAIAPLTAKYIRSGQVSYEVRHALRDSFDVVATLLARCNGPAAFFATAPVLFAQQGQWLGKGGAWGETAKLDGLAPGETLGRIAQGAGLDQFFRQRGLAPQRMAACLGDVAEGRRLSAQAQAIWGKPGFPGTPAFEVDGAPVAIRSWPELDARLAGALA